MKPIDADKIVFRYAANGEKYVTPKDIKNQPKFFPMCGNCAFYDSHYRECLNSKSIYHDDTRDKNHVCEMWEGAKKSTEI